MHPFSASGLVGRDGLVTYSAVSGERVGTGEKSRPRREEGTVAGVGVVGVVGVVVVVVVGGGGVVVAACGVCGARSPPFSCGAAATAGAGSELVATTNLKSSKERTHESAAVRRGFIRGCR